LSLPAPEIIAAEIVEGLQAALDEWRDCIDAGCDGGGAVIVAVAHAAYVVNTFLFAAEKSASPQDALRLKVAISPEGEASQRAATVAQ
jgi:hypothetical protein